MSLEGPGEVAEEVIESVVQAPVLALADELHRFVADLSRTSWRHGRRHQQNALPAVGTTLGIAKSRPTVLRA